MAHFHTINRKRKRNIVVTQLSSRRTTTSAANTCEGKNGEAPVISRARNVGREDKGKKAPKKSVLPLGRKEGEGGGGGRAAREARKPSLCRTNAL